MGFEMFSKLHGSQSQMDHLLKLRAGFQRGGLLDVNANLYFVLELLYNGEMYMLLINSFLINTIM